MILEILRWVRSHSFAAHISGDAIEVSIPWRHVTTGAVGSDVMRVRTWSEARAAIGY